MCVGLTRTESVIIDSVGGRAHTHICLVRCGYVI